MLASRFPRAHVRYTALPILGGVWDGFCDWLEAQGYPDLAIRRRLVVGRHLEDALRRRHVRHLAEVTAAELRSLAPRAAHGKPMLMCALVRSLTDYLEEQGALAPAPTTPTDERLAEYCHFLEKVRGLAPATVVRHRLRVAEFLRFLEYDTQPQRLRRLTIVDVDTFVGHAGKRLGRVSMRDVASTLRTFLRFLAANGDVASGLDAQIESPRCFRGERLPRALPWEAVGSLLAAVDRSTAKGRRDYAMLLLIATYGLRAGEIASLTIDDVSWRTQQIRVSRPKVGTPLLLPLTDYVATALVDYLRHARAPSRYRHLFLRLRVPPGPIYATAVADVFDVWAARAAIPDLPPRAGGPHCLRHSVAVHLLRQGTPLKTIGDLLGHRSAEATCDYLRLQLQDLRDVALPLPATVGSAVVP